MDQLALRRTKRRRRRARIERQPHISEQFLRGGDHTPVADHRQARRAQLLPKKDIFIDRQIRKYLLILRRQDQTIVCGLLRIADHCAAPVYVNLPAVRLKYAHNHRKQRALTRGVAPHDGAYLPLAQRQINVMQIKFTVDPAA